MTKHLPSSWKVVYSDDIVSGERSIVSGPFGSNIGKRFFVESGIPVIRGNNLTLGDKRFVDEGYVFLTEEKAKQFKNCQAIAGDIVFTAAGTLGQVGLIPKNAKFPVYIISNKQLRVRPDPRIALPGYIYYWFSSKGVRNHIIGLNTGSSVPLITLGKLRSVPINLPPLPTQRKIAAILSDYDDLIENNLRRIKILEEMAQTIYREWFVKFRFSACAEALEGRPGHEKVKMVDSPLGKIPEGWEVRQIGEVIETLGGGTPSTKESSYWDDGNIDWYSPSDLTASGSMFINGSSKRITQLGLNKSSAKLFPAYSLMMTSRATIGVVAINTEKACTNQGFITCIPNDRLSVFHLYFWTKESRDKIISVASGATFKEISRGEFREFPIVVPPPPIENTFTETVEPMCRLIENLIKKDHNLRQTRDLLLPKLISGELDMSELEIKTSELEEN